MRFPERLRRRARHPPLGSDPGQAPQSRPRVAVGIDDTIMVKRLEKRPGKLVLVSDNRAYETVLIDSDAANVRILGRVIWLQRRI